MFLVHAAETTWQNCMGGISTTDLTGAPTLKCAEIIFERVLIFLSSLVIVVLFLMFVVGSFTYLTSFGNPEKVKKAQSILKYAIVGFILFICAFLILKTIDLLFLGGYGEIFQFRIGK